MNIPRAAPGPDARSACQMKILLASAVILLLASSGLWGQTGGLVRAVHGRAAYAYTAHVVSFGVRAPATPGHARTIRYILRELRADHAGIETVPYIAHTPGGTFHEEDIVAKFPGTGKGQGVLAVCGHFDTKIEKKFRFVGANDGGSSTGMLLEFAHVLATHRLRKPVWLLFLDGEEAVVHWQGKDNDYGSRHLAHLWVRQGVAPRIRALILVDMIGDKDLDILRETNSTPWLNSFIQSAADKLGYSRYFFKTSSAVEDDHIPFLHAGIPAVDLIDFTYGPNNSQSPGPYWHTAQDTMNKLSPHSFRVVGRVVAKALEMLAAQ